MESDPVTASEDSWRLAFESVPEGDGQLRLYDPSLGVESCLSTDEAGRLLEVEDRAARA
jgi:hypothetical protein